MRKLGDGKIFTSKSDMTVSATGAVLGETSRYLPLGSDFVIPACTPMVAVAYKESETNHIQVFLAKGRLVYVDSFVFHYYEEVEC